MTWLLQSDIGKKGNSRSYWPLGESLQANLRFIAAAWYMAFAAIVAYTRYRVRRHRQILHGDVLTDMCIAVLFYPLALVQHEKELRAPDDFYIPEKESEEKEA